MSGPPAPDREARLRRLFAESLSGYAVPERLDARAPAGPEPTIHGTVLFADIRNFNALAEKLDAAEVKELLETYFGRVSEPLARQGARHLRFFGDCVIAVFPAEPAGGGPLPPARRAVSAALNMALAAHEFRRWLDARFVGRGLPPCAVGVGLHEGAITLGRGDDAGATGDTVGLAARIEAASREFGWTVVASSAVLAAAGAGIQTGGMTSLAVRGGNRFMDVAEIAGIATTEEDRRHGMAVLAERAQDIRAAIEANSALTARAVKGALQSKLSALGDPRLALGDAPVRLKNYRIERKIGGGLMTDVYLAVREPDGLPVVVKVLKAAGRDLGDALARFIQEYTLLSRIAHAHVVRIYDQGFTRDHAYLAMEYFEAGDLRAELRARMTRRRVLDVLTQLARALAEVHGRGVIHRDLKPENVMCRLDGTVALADFGIARAQLLPSAGGAAPGERLGTPYYLSPEQAAGEPVGPASDLYSLGVMAFEMLAGERPYRADSLALLLQSHRAAPVPALPVEHASLQPLVSRLMAKAPHARFGSAAQLLEALAALRGWGTPDEPHRP